MIINIALGIVLGVIMLLVIAVAVYVLSVALTKHRELSDNYNDIDEWFHSENLADRINRIRERSRR